VATFLTLKPESFKVPSERVMWDLIDKSLDDKWTVIFNVYVRQLQRRRKEPKEPNGKQNQIDFVLLHPDVGVFILDAKGGQWRIDGDGSWRTSGDGFAIPHNPPELANDQLGNFQRQMREMIGHKKSQSTWLIGFVDCEPPFLPTISEDQFLGLRELKSLDSELRRIAAKFNLEPIGRQGVRQLCEKIQPKVPLLRMVSAASSRNTLEQIEREGVGYVEASKNQIFVTKQIQSNQRLSVVGGAGTGKSLIAASVAVFFSDFGPDKSVLFVVHRKSSAANARMLLGVPILPLDLDLYQSENIVVATEAELAKMILKSDLQLATNQVGAEDYFLSGGRLFDVLIIDEAQEFDQWTIETLQYFLVDPRNSPVYLFADPFQWSGRRKRSLRRRYSSLPKSTDRAHLIEPIAMPAIPDSGEPVDTAAEVDERGISSSRVDSRRFFLDWPDDFAYSIALTKNHRNSEPIGQLAYNFQPNLFPEFVVTEGVMNKFIVVHDFNDENQIERELAREIDFLLGVIGGFLPCEILVADVDFNSEKVKGFRKDWTFVDPDAILRFPLPRHDRRIVRGDADHVQGLQAPAVIVVIHGEIGSGDSYEGLVKTLRDIYVASSRAMSNLTVISKYSENELFSFNQLVPLEDGSWPDLAHEWYGDLNHENMQEGESGVE